MAAPTITTTIVTTAGSRMANCGVFAYVTVSNTGDAGSEHQCRITWKVTYADGTPVLRPISFSSPLPLVSGDANVALHQKGWVAWCYFDAAGTYRFTATVTNSTGTSTTDSDAGSYADVIVAADTRTYYYVSPNGSDSANGTASTTPFLTWAKAIATVGTDKGILLESGQTFNVSADWNPQSKTNMRVGIYSGSARAVLNWTGPASGSRFINLLSSDDGFILENIFFNSAFFTESGPIGIDAGHAGKNVSVVNCEFRNMSKSCQSTVGAGGTLVDGYALINCVSDHSSLYGFYLNECSDIVILGTTVKNLQVSHACRIGSEVASITGVTRAQIGYTTLDANFSPGRNGLDHASLRSYMPYTFVHSSKLVGGHIHIEAGSSTNSYYRVFDRCWIGNGNGQAIAIYGGNASNIRISGCIIDLDNRYYTGQTPGGYPTSYGAIICELQGNLVGLVVEGLTIILGDEWLRHTGNAEPVFEVEDHGYTCTTCTVQNLLVVHNSALVNATDMVQVPASGFTFAGNVWPAVTGTAFKVGTTSYSLAQWLAGISGAVVAAADAMETVDRDTLSGQRYLPNRRRQPVASVASVASKNSYGDYYGSPFDSAGGHSGAVSGGKQLVAIGP